MASNASSAVASTYDHLLDMTPAGPRLIGGRRKSDGRTVFPFPQGPEARFYDPIHLGTEGTLWSYTVQRFRPKSPPYEGADDQHSFRPFALGYIELPGQVIVESRIVVDDPSTLKIGMPMVLVAQEFARQASGTALTYAFAPKTVSTKS